MTIPKSSGGNWGTLHTIAGGVTLDTSLPLDIVLPCQYGPQAPTIPPGIRELWTALLTGALQDLAKPCPHATPDGHLCRIVRARIRAQEWFAGAEAAAPFTWVCAVLRLNPDAVRRALPHLGRIPRHSYARRRYATHTHSPHRA